MDCEHLHPVFRLFIFSLAGIILIRLVIYIFFRRYFHNVEYRMARRFENGSVIVISYNRQDDVEKGVWIRHY
ncbi:hypothetical protein SCHPADRAFT_900692 [Schizopora paradoxa]|uniref:Uncharacterized protein n=1 Tax=Schizopora paradoxa TaxID=27342 RepID=A0A0H2S0D6_9AGAM|nr:hypothetical protein SCHPADRAFT_900692 [Schizopora paradoxa]